MQIRERGNRWQLLESFYDKEKKRSGQKQIASQEQFHRDVTPEVEEKLTEDQVAEFKAFLDDVEAKRLADHRRLKLAVTGSYMSQAAHLLNEGYRFEDEGIEKDPDDIYAAMEELKKALRKAGYKRPVKAPKTQNGKDDRQADLIPENASESG